MKVEHEALLTKYELTVNEQGDKLKKTHTALQETEHVVNERVKIIDQLESTNAELVSFKIHVVTKFHLLFFTFLQEFHRNQLQSRLEGATKDIDSLNSDLDTLKAGFNTVVEIFHNYAGEPATPTHEYEPVNEKTSSVMQPGKEEAMPVSNRKLGSSSLPNWVTSPVSHQ